MHERLEAISEPEAAPEALADTVGRVIAEVLETMFFAEAVPAACGHEWLGPAAGSGIRFAGSHVGEMRLRVSGDAADSIACAFLGIETAELTEALRTQVLLELTNILCGAIVSHLWPQSELALAPPEICAIEEPLGKGAPHPGALVSHALYPRSLDPRSLHQCFELPEGKLAVGMDWREAAGPVRPREPGKQDARTQD